MTTGMPGGSNVSINSDTFTRSIDLKVNTREVPGNPASSTASDDATLIEISECSIAIQDSTSNGNGITSGLNDDFQETLLDGEQILGIGKSNGKVSSSGDIRDGPHSELPKKEPSRTSQRKLSARKSWGSSTQLYAETPKGSKIIGKKDQEKRSLRSSDREGSSAAKTKVIFDFDYYSKSFLFFSIYLYWTMLIKPSSTRLF